jgi:hypothetical protein
MAIPHRFRRAGHFQFDGTTKTFSNMAHGFSLLLRGAFNGAANYSLWAPPGHNQQSRAPVAAERGAWLSAQSASGARMYLGFL